MSQAVPSAKIDPDSRKEFAIGRRPAALAVCLSTRNEISTAISSVSLAGMFHCAVPLSNSPCVSLVAGFHQIFDGRGRLLEHGPQVVPGNLLDSCFSLPCLAPVYELAQSFPR